jgi:CRP/FNR family cyclic AMP-dependent transcriptional regulator
MAERERALSRAPLFSTLPKRHQRAIAKVTGVWTYPKDSVIVREGKPGASFFVILEGRAIVRRGTRTVGRLSSGEFFGEISLLDPGPRTASVIAETDVTCLELAAKDFLDVIDAENAIAGSILRVLARRLREAERPLVG